MTDAVLAGQVLTAAAVQAERARVRYFTKTAAQSHTSNITLTNDDTLTCSMQANSVYQVAIHAVIGGTDGNLQTAWTVPSGATGFRQALGPTVASTDRTDTNARIASHNFATVSSYGVNSATLYAHVEENGLVRTTTAGTFAWQHSQDASTANPSAVVEHTFMIVTKVG